MSIAYKILWRKLKTPRDVTYSPAIQFSKFCLFCADFRSRTCGAMRRPQDVRHAQLAAQTKNEFEKSSYPLFYPVLEENTHAIIL